MNKAKVWREWMKLAGLMLIAIAGIVLVSCSSLEETPAPISSDAAQTTILQGQINSTLHNCLLDTSCNGGVDLNGPFIGWERNKVWKVLASEDLGFELEDLLIYLRETLGVDISLAASDGDIEMSYHPEIPATMRRCGADSVATHDASWTGCTSIAVVDNEITSAQIVLWSNNPGTILHELLHALVFVNGHVSSRPSVMNPGAGVEEMTELDIELAKFYLGNDVHPGLTLSSILADYTAVEGLPIAHVTPPSESGIPRLELTRRIADLASHRRTTIANWRNCDVKDEIWEDWEVQHPSVTIGRIGRADNIHLATDYLDGLEGVLLGIEVACQEEVENKAALQSAVTELEARINVIVTNFNGFCSVPSSIDPSGYTYSASTYDNTMDELAALGKQLTDLEETCEGAMEEHLRVRIEELEPGLRELKLSFPDFCGATFAREFPNFSDDYELPIFEEFLVSMPIWEIDHELTALRERIERMYHSCHIDRHTTRLAQMQVIVQPWAGSHYCDIKSNLQREHPGVSDVFSIDAWTSAHSVRDLEIVLVNAERQATQLTNECRIAKEEAADSQIQSIRALRDSIQSQIATQCNAELHFQRQGGEMYTLLYKTPSLNLILYATVGQPVDTYPMFQLTKNELEHLRGLCSQLPIARSWMTLTIETPASISEFYLQEGQTLTYTLEGLEFSPPPTCEGQMDLVEDHDWNLEYAVYSDPVKEVYVPEGNTLCVNYYNADDSELWFDNGQEGIQLMRGDKPISMTDLDEGTYRFTVGTYYWGVAINQRTAEIGFRVYVGTAKQLDATEALELVLHDPQGNLKHLAIPQGTHTVSQSGIYTLSVGLTGRAQEYQWSALIGSLGFGSVRPS